MESKWRWIPTHYRWTNCAGRPLQRPRPPPAQRNWCQSQLSRRNAKMYANQTRFHMLLGQCDWARTAIPNDSGIFQIPNSKFEWDNGNQELRLRSELFRFKAAPLDNPPTQDDRRGAAADSYNNWFWIGTNRDEI